MRTFQTLNLLPDLAGRRFATISVGTQNVTQIRDEHSLLRSAVAIAMGIPADELTIESVEAFVGGTWVRPGVTETENPDDDSNRE